MSATASSALSYSFESPLLTTGTAADRQFLVDEKHFRFTSSIFHLVLVADTANCLGRVHAANCLARNGAAVSRITRDVLAIFVFCVYVVYSAHQQKLFCSNLGFLPMLGANNIIIRYRQHSYLQISCGEESLAQIRSGVDLPAEPITAPRQTVSGRRRDAAPRPFYRVLTAGGNPWLTHLAGSLTTVMGGYSYGFGSGADCFPSGCKTSFIVPKAPLNPP